MSVKDLRYQRHCPICDDTLPGSDDGLLVFESLKEQVAELDAGEDEYTPNCTLCGEECPLAKARLIIANGEPTLEETGKNEDDEEYFR